MKKLEFKDSEIVIGLVGAVGTDLRVISDSLSDRLKTYSYESVQISVSNDIISRFLKSPIPSGSSEYDRITTYMDAGDQIRFDTKNKSILASGVAALIQEKRETSNPLKRRTAYIIRSLKNKYEVKKLREIYRNGFYLLCVYSDKSSRTVYLKENQKIDEEKAIELIERDENADNDYGQHTRDAFQLGDFFINLDDYDNAIASIDRIIGLIFSNPFITPTFDEYAMFMAYANSLRSADLSRQVGAVITKSNEIIASGANDCPKAFGGLYWHEYSTEQKRYYDFENGKDFTRGEDSNKIEINNKIKKIAHYLEIEDDQDKIQILYDEIGSITEYGRVVHAEMEALSMCARNNISARDSILYCTTYPCHNCAKHLIASGISKIVYIEPYPKSKTMDFYFDSVSYNESDKDKKVVLVPFIGVGPKRYIEMFAMNFDIGYDKIRKNKEGKKIEWTQKDGVIRHQMLPYSYLDQEKLETIEFNNIELEAQI